MLATDDAGPGRPHDRRAVPRPRCARGPGQRRLQPAHVHVRAVRVRQDATPWACCWSRCSPRPSCASIILDPNSDYVGLGRVRRGRADPTPRSATGDVPGQVAVWGNDERADHPLRLRFAELDTEAQAAVLGLDPVRDRDEYAVAGRPAPADRRTASSSSPGSTSSPSPTRPGARQLGLRAANLGVLRLGRVGPRPAVDPPGAREPDRPGARSSTWARSAPPRSSALVAQAVLSHAVGAAGRPGSPCLVVIDEAHNICAADPQDPLERALHRASGPDRGGGPQVRPLPARLHPGAAQGARERGLAVRQRGDDADELPGRHRGADQPLLLRPARAWWPASRRSAWARRWWAARSSR